VKLGNSVAKALTTIGIIIILGGLILGVILGNNNDLYGYDTNYTVVVTWSAVGIISGMLIIGLSEVIKILHEINLKLNMSKDMEESNANQSDKIYTRKEASQALNNK
jgi:ABC-type sulfate transport system permease component